MQIIKDMNPGRKIAGRNQSTAGRTGHILLLVVMMWWSPIFPGEDFPSARIDEYDWQSIPPSLADSISLDRAKTTFGEALEIIAAKSGFKLNYNRDRVPVDRMVTLEPQKVPIFELLFTLLQRTRTTLIVTPDREFAVVPTGRDRSASVSGQVFNAVTGRPLVGTNISIMGTYTGCVSDSTGRFTLSKVPEGYQIVQFAYIGYEIRKVVTYASNPKLTPGLNVGLRPQEIPLEEITVTPGLFSVMGKGPTMRQTLTQEDMENITFGEDVYRALTRLPGVGANDFSAKFTVRGGENEEILVLLDGAEIYEPFHLKDIAGGAFSFIDVGVIEGVDLLTGGFPADYGNRMSGVLNMKTIRPPISTKHASVGLSMMNAHFRSKGTFNGSQGAWVVSARRGFLDVLLNMVGANEEDIPRPAYYDVHGKLDYQLDRKRHYSLHVLHAGDHTDYVEEGVRLGETNFSSTYGWINYRSNPFPNLFSQTVVSAARLYRLREAEDLDPTDVEVFTMLDHRDARVFGWRQGWNVQYTPNWHIKGGFSVQRHESDYRFDIHVIDETQINSDSVDIYEMSDQMSLNPVGNSFSTHISNRFKILDSLVVEIGLRYDAIGYSESKRLSPRLNLVWAPADQTFIRVGWGHFYQNDGIHEIRVADGEDGFLAPERAEHWVAGFEHTYQNGLNLRLEGYYKNL
ncbi:MAG: TonB-dependent receptor [Fidelibacterota bacterium]|nr:MAG: TonB-dependent receptor [Candidatus Neomarinimicrobiota bacterium]